MGRIRILHFYKSFNEYNGLIEILTILAQGMDLDRFDLGVVVFEYGGNAFGNKFEKLGGRIYCLDVRDQLRNQPRGILELRKFLERNTPDILQTHVLKANLYGILAARMSHVPGVIATEMTLKDIAHSSFARLRDRCVQPMVSAMLRYCDYFMVTSEYIKRQWYSPAYASKFKVIYPPFNIDKYNEAAAHAGSSALPRDGKRVIGCIGRLSEEKGVQVLLEAMAHVQKQATGVVLVVVGTGPFETYLRQMTHDLGLDEIVEFAGFSANVFLILKGVDLLVIPSRTEGAPLVAIEAMSMGIPVVATNVGGLPELVTDGVTGYLVPASDPEALAQSILRTLNDLKRSKEMGGEGKKRAFAQFHPSVFIRNMEEMYAGLYSRKVAGA